LLLSNDACRQVQSSATDAAAAAAVAAELDDEAVMQAFISSLQQQ